MCLFSTFSILHFSHLYLFFFFFLLIRNGLLYLGIDLKLITRYIVKIVFHLFSKSPNMKLKHELSLLHVLELTFSIHSFKGHDMLAPFTAGWQTTDVNPLVIAKSEVLKFLSRFQFH